MQPRITVITLGVEDLKRSLRFDRDGLGLPTDGIVGQEFEKGAVAFFDLQGAIEPAIRPRENVASDAGLPVGSPGSTEFTLGHDVASKGEVNAAMASARGAGAVTVKAPNDTFWGGYAGCFQDPDGHL